MYFFFFLQEVVNKSHISGELFSAFLQQNYVNFFDSIDDLERASVYLSDANFITLDWAVSSSIFISFGSCFNL